MLTLPESGNRIEIGNNCMFSFGIQLRTEDGHAIYDITTKQLINKVEAVLSETMCGFAVMFYL